MANVPYDEGAAQTVQGDTRVPIDDYQHLDVKPEMFGSQIGQGLQTLGAGMVKASSFYGQISADDMVNQYMKESRTLLTGDPSKVVGQDSEGKPIYDTGYFGLKGADQLRARAATEKQLDDIIKDKRQNLQTPEAQFQFDTMSRRMRMQQGGQIDNSAETQNTVWGLKVSQDQIEQHRTEIANDAYNDENFKNHLADLTQGYLKQVDLAGTGAAGAAEAKQKALADGWNTRIETIAVKDPAIAQKMADDHKTELGAAYAPLAERLRVRGDEAQGNALADEHIVKAKTGQTPAGTTPEQVKAPPPSAAATPTAGASPTDPATRVVGDSYGDGVKKQFGLQGSTLTGMNPEQVTEVLKGNPVTNHYGTTPGLSDADIKAPLILSSGAANNKDAASLLEGQLATIRKRRGVDDLSNVTVMGVTSYAGYGDANATLKTISDKYGAHFQPIDPANKTVDEKHPSDYGAIFAKGGAAGQGTPGGTSKAASIDPSKLDWSLNSGNAQHPGPQLTEKSAYLMHVGVNRLGATPQAAAAMVGNVIAESSLKTNASNEQGESSHGLFQWNQAAGRWQPFLNWAQANGKNATDPIAQMEYAKVEAQKIPMGDGTPRSVWDAVNEAKTSAEANHIWLKHFESPSDQSQMVHDWRQKNVDLASSAFSGTAVSSAAYAVGSGSPHSPSGPHSAMAYAEPASPNGGQPSPQAIPAPVEMPGPAQPSTAADPDSFEQVHANAAAGIMASNVPDNIKEIALRKLNQKIAEQEVLAGATERMQRQQSDKAADGYVTAMMTGKSGPGIITQIAQDPHLTPEVKEHLYEAAKKYTGSDYYQAKNEYGSGFWDTMKAFTDPNNPLRPTSYEDLIKRTGPSGDLTIAGAHELEAERQKLAKNPDQAAISEARNSILSGIKARMSFDQEQLYAGVPQSVLRDPKGELLFHEQAIPQYLAQFSSWVEKGNDPWKFLNDKTIPETIAERLRPERQRLTEKLEAGGEQVPSPQGFVAPVAPPHVDPKAWSSLTTTPPILDGKFASSYAWDKLLTMIAANPSRQFLDTVNKSPWGTKGKVDAFAIAKQMGLGSMPDAAAPYSPPIQAVLTREPDAVTPKFNPADLISHNARTTVAEEAARIRREKFEARK